jgi:hypothetical protein
MRENRQMMRICFTLSETLEAKNLPMFMDFNGEYETAVNTNDKIENSQFYSLGVSILHLIDDRLLSNIERVSERLAKFSNPWPSRVALETQAEGFS